MMEINFVPSLKLMTLNKIAISLAVKKNVIISMPETINPFVNLCNDSFGNTAFHENMIREIKLLPLPHSLKYELFATYKEITNNIRIWKQNNKNSNLFYEFLHNHFYLVKWSPHGDIDDEETAKTLLNLEDLDVKRRYSLACYYSLENYILKLRPEVDAFDIRETLPTTNMVLSAISLYWYSKQDTDLPLEINQRRFDIKRLYLKALKLKNLGAMKFFFNKLNNEGKRSVAERNVSAMNFLMREKVHSSHSTGLFLFLFHQVKRTVPKFDLIRFAPDFVNYFLRWPMQKHFFHVFDQLFQYLEARDFNDLLSFIAHKAQDGWMLYPYHQAFRSVWLQGTEEMKKYVVLKVAKHSNPYVMHYLSLDIVSRRLVLKKAGEVIADIKEEIRTNPGTDLWQSLENDWDVELILALNLI